VAIACAGREGRLGLEDLLCAGLIVEALEESVPGVRPSDGARTALALAAAIGAPTPDFLATTAAGVALVRIGLEQDLAFCAEVDVSPCVPVLWDGGFVLAERIEGD
jgi:2-phosphosulfolactate phosphatase